MADVDNERKSAADGDDGSEREEERNKAPARDDGGRADEEALEEEEDALQVTSNSSSGGYEGMKSPPSVIDCADTEEDMKPPARSEGTGDEGTKVRPLLNDDGGDSDEGRKLPPPAKDRANGGEEEQTPSDDYVADSGAEVISPLAKVDDTGRDGSRDRKPPARMDNASDEDSFEKGNASARMTDDAEDDATAKMRYNAHKRHDYCVSGKGGEDQAASGKDNDESIDDLPSGRVPPPSAHSGDYSNRVARELRRAREYAEQVKAQEQRGHAAEHGTSEEESGMGEAPGDAFAAAYFNALQSSRQAGSAPGDAFARSNRQETTEEIRETTREGTGEELDVVGTESAENAQLPSVQPPPTTAEGDIETRPGAYAAPGRALGNFPEWGRRFSQQIERHSIWPSRLSGQEHTEMSIEATVVNDRELEDTIRLQILANAVRAEVVEPQDNHNFIACTCSKPSNSWRHQAVWLIPVIVVLGFVIGLSVGLTGRGESDNDTLVSITADNRSSRPMLEVLVQRGTLRCGIYRSAVGISMTDESGERKGFAVDLCRAVAAAVLGDSYRIEFIEVASAERFVTLASGAVDILFTGDTHTLERDVYEADAKVGFSFSAPYLYDGLSFGGIPPYAHCADQLSTLGNCTNLKVCVVAGTTWMDAVTELLPGSSIVEIVNSREGFEGLGNGKCNAIVGEMRLLSKESARVKGYTGPYEIGSNLYSKEPLAMVTRDDDPQWSDFVNWVLQALLAAEEQNITQTTAKAFAETSVFGDQFKNMFRIAIAAVGNYGEVFERHLGPIIPRQSINMINTGDTGLLYTHPFGQVLNDGPGPVKGGIIEKIKKRGHLLCGITAQSGFGEVNPTTHEGRGLDADFCRAVAESIFEGAANSVKFVETHETNDGFHMLADGAVDVLSGGSINIERDVHEPSSRVGFSFSQPYFYDSHARNHALARRLSLDGETRALVTRQDDPQWSAFVYWVVTSTFFAEENGITQMTSNVMPAVNLFGPNCTRMLRDAILAVGNYGEMYDRNVESIAPRSGHNLLNTNPFGPQHYPFPFF